MASCATDGGGGLERYTLGMDGMRKAYSKWRGGSGGGNRRECHSYWAGYSHFIALIETDLIDCIELS